jgi:carboxyl-terminal processing protease
MNKQKIKVFIPILFSVAVILGMFIGYKLHSNMPNKKSFFGVVATQPQNEILHIIQQRYVDSVDNDKLSNAAIDAMLNELDPHSIYIPFQKLNEINEDLDGSFQGIGIEFNILKDTVHVLHVVESGPSEKAGIKTGDKILKVDEHNAVGVKDTEVFKKWVKGPKGTSVLIQYLSDGSIENKKINRDDIPLPSLDAFYMIDNTKGYIKLNRFSNNTYKEFLDALQMLTKKGMKQLILDLRDNGGGILEEAIDIIDELVGGDQLIVYTEGLKNPKKEYKAKRKGIFEDGKIIVLLNESSASASEVIAGSLQDLDRATIIGRRSFGKGLVQEQFSLSDGSALRLTTARYYTPLGRSIQKPYDNGMEAYASEIMQRFHTNEKNDTSKSKNEQVFTTVKGKKLYGGGGITPDIIVPFEQILLDTNLNVFYKNNLLSFFAYKYYMQHRKEIKSFGSFQSFNANFNMDESTFKALMKETESNIQLNPAQQHFIMQRFKAMLGRMQWGQSASTYVLNAKDQTYLKAVQSLN